MSTTRSENMHKRRTRILTEARNIIAHRGADALNLRDLASASDVTVPTIYNLIGNKSELLEALLREGMALFTGMLENSLDLTLSERINEIADTIVGFFGENEDYYRAMGIAGENLEHQYDINGKTGVMRNALEDMVQRDCQNALDTGELRGNISAELLTECILSSLQTSCRDWFYGTITLEEFRSTFLKGSSLCLAADASNDCRDTLLELIHRESADQNH